MEKCRVCGTGNPTHVIQDETFYYKEHPVIVTDYESYECSVCGESFGTGNSNKRASYAMQCMKHEVEGLLICWERREYDNGCCCSDVKSSALVSVPTFTCINTLEALHFIQQ